MSHNFSVTVNADYSQFELSEVDEPDDAPELITTHLSYVLSGTIIMTVEREYGEVALDVRIHDARPEPLDNAWLDVAEFSVVTPDELWVLGWAGDQADGLQLPIPPGQAHRVRYAIANMDGGDWHDDGTTQRYSLELWPEDPSPAVTVAQATAAGRYWFEARVIERVRMDVHARRDDTAEAERFAAFADGVFTALPELRSEVLSNESRCRSLASSAIMLMDYTTTVPATPATIERMRAHEDRIALILRELASRN